MTNDNILEDSKRKFENGADYSDISIFLKENKADEATRKRVFDELDVIKKSKATNKVDISIGKLIIGLPLTSFGTYLLYTGQFSWRNVLILAIIVIAAGIVSLVEIGKVINNIVRK